MTDPAHLLPVDTLHQAIGVWRIPVPIPFLEAGGPINVYFIENSDGTFTLFDAGIATPEGEAALRSSAAACGLPLSKVTRILISHGHVDHFGFAQTLAEETGAVVYVHQDDWSKVVGESTWMAQLDTYLSYFRKLGVPEFAMAVMEESFDSAMNFARRVDLSRAKMMLGDERFSFAHFVGEVLHLPGHTPGLVCLFDAQHRVFFSGDHLLSQVSPNPVLELGSAGEENKFKSLVGYLKSAKIAYELDIDWVLPGHGQPFRNHRALLDELFCFYNRRQSKLVARLVDSEKSAYELVKMFFGRADNAHLFFTLSEIIGNLEVLEANGRVCRRLEDGVYRFRSIRSSRYL